MRMLHAKMTGWCGVVHATRKGMLILKDKMSSGNKENQQCKKIPVVKWHDKQDVTKLTTIHKDEMMETEIVNWRRGERKKKPQRVVHYKKNMGLVDKSNMKMSFADVQGKH